VNSSVVTVAEWLDGSFASNNKSERPQVNIFGHLKDFEISKYKRFFSFERT
jgi:hypothetical protein